MKKFSNARCLLILLLLLPCPVLAWDGTDSETGDSVEIEKGNLVRQGQDIEFYDEASGEYHSGEVQSVDTYGSGAQIEIEDSDTGETRTFDMD